MKVWGSFVMFVYKKCLGIAPLVPQSICFVSVSPSIQPVDKNATPGGLYCLSQKPIELQWVTNIHSQKQKQ